MIEASPIPYALNDDAGNIIYLNPEFVRTFGYTLADLPTVDAWWPRAYPDPEYRAQIAAQWNARLATAQRTGRAFEAMEAVVRAKGGELHIVMAHATPLDGAMAGVHLVLLYDVTKERQLAEQQRLLQEHLMEARRLESLGRLAGGIAHDFNNTLGVILGRAGLALKSTTPGSEVQGHLVEILEAARHSAKLIQQLLAYAKRQPAAPHVLDPNEAVESSMRILGLLVGENIRLRWGPGEAIWPIEIDPAQFAQILTNLCSNARDETPAGGEIAIRTENFTLADTTAPARPLLAPGDYVVLIVRDAGAGVAPAIAGRIFEPLFTTKEPSKGHHGLGLSTVYGIARQNGGGVIVESAPGGGSVFKVLLPRAPA